MKRRHFAILSVMAALALPAAAQMGQMGIMGNRMPTLSGVWHPVIGSGADYDRTVTATGEKMQIEMTVVGKDEIAGKTGYWLEFAISSSKMPGGQMLMKELMAIGDDGVTAGKIVMQQPGQTPMEIELSGNPMARNMQAPTPADVREKGEVVGTETITVPAGTFSCQHIRQKDGSNDAWISDKVSPWSLVKYQDSKSTMVLTKVISDAKDRITGTPTKFDPTQMMRNHQ